MKKNGVLHDADLCFTSAGGELVEKIANFLPKPERFQLFDLFLHSGYTYSNGLYTLQEKTLR